MQTYLYHLLSATEARRMRVIENILLDRRTVTTLFWGLQYGILPWLGYGKQWSRQALDLQFQQLERQQMIEAEAKFVRLTAQGVADFNNFKRTAYQPHHVSDFAHFRLQELSQRFLLASQVVSEYSYVNQHYVPASFDEDDLSYVKAWFRHQSKDTVVHEFKTAVSEYLRTLDDSQANFFAEFLIGHDQPGQALAQLANQFAIPDQVAVMQWQDLLVGLVKFVRVNEYPLAKFFQPLENETLVSQSAQISFQLSIERSWSCSEIGRFRHLKESTIREHILETAIFQGPQFPYDHFVPLEMQRAIEGRYPQLKVSDWNFQQVTEDQNLDFFYFRLVQIMRSTDK